MTPPETPPSANVTDISDQVSERSNAEALGSGIPKPRVVVKREKNEVKLDPSPVWVDSPTKPGQFLDPEMHRIVGSYVRIFDFSKSAELQEYNDLLTKAADIDRTNEFVVREELKYSGKTDNWKAIVFIRKMQFRQIVEKQNN